MHTLAFLDPGHFHATLTLRERCAAVSPEVFVYATAGPELDDFLALVDRFNRRAERPTAWRPRVRLSADPLAQLLAERPGDLVVRPACTSWPTSPGWWRRRTSPRSARASRAGRSCAR